MSTSQTFGEFIQGVVRNTRDVTLRTMNTQSGPDGGFAVPEEEMLLLWERAVAGSHLLSRCIRVTTTKPSVRVTIPDDGAGYEDGSGQLLIGDVEEMGEFPISLCRSRQATMEMKKSGGVVQATNEFLEDTPSAQALISLSFERALRTTMERRIWLGGSAGRSIGVTQSPSLIVQPLEATQTIANSAQFFAINAANMVAQMIDLESAAFHVNPDLLATLLRTTQNSNEKRLITPPDADAPFGRIATRPLFPNYAAPPVGTVGDFVCASLRDYLVITKGAAKTAVSGHVLFLQEESLIRFSIRWNSQPMLSRTITPPYTTTPKSHYVALAARS